ncbi:hypothetical protein AUJ84_02715 [Candidatus Pacearchaeota archaeon CG1_02_32_132]|nr:MAG: hypothetical protein AUJ84_02715 [Candidatus Pacearchaeota archaeon CG1_02_32_132]
MSNLYAEQSRRNHEEYVGRFNDHGAVVNVRNSFVNNFRGIVPAEEFALILGQLGGDMMPIRVELQIMASDGERLANYTNRKEGKN